MYNNSYPQFSARPPRFQGMSGTFVPFNSNQSLMQQSNPNLHHHQQLDFHSMRPVLPSFPNNNYPNMSQNLQLTDPPPFLMRPPQMMLNNDQLPYSPMPVVPSPLGFRADFNSTLPTPRPSMQCHSSSSTSFHVEKTVPKNPDQIIVEQYLAKIGKLTNAADIKPQKSSSTKLLKVYLLTLF